MPDDDLEGAAGAVGAIVAAYWPNWPPSTRPLCEAVERLREAAIGRPSLVRDAKVIAPHI